MNNKLYKLGLSLLTLALVFAVFCGMFCGCTTTPANPDIVITVHDGDNGLLELEYTINNEEMYEYNYGSIGYLLPDTFDLLMKETHEDCDNESEYAQRIVDNYNESFVCFRRDECKIDKDDIYWSYIQIIVDPEVPYGFIQKHDNTVFKVCMCDVNYVCQAHTDVLLALYDSDEWLHRMVGPTSLHIIEGPGFERWTERNDVTGGEYPWD